MNDGHVILRKERLDKGEKHLILLQYDYDPASALYL